MSGECDKTLIYSDRDNTIELKCMGSEDHIEYVNHYALVRYDGKLLEISWRNSEE